MDMHASALALFENDRQAAIHWLTTPQLAFGGATPIELARTESGALEVLQLIERLENGVFS